MSNQRNPDGICAGRTVIVTGAGRGLGRAHALAFAAEGANVVVNDVGASLTGEGHDVGPAAEVVAEIVAMGGRAIVNADDVSDWDGAGHMVAEAIETFGGLDTLVCNAGIVRDRMIVNMSVDEWDAVMKVHLRGMFCPVRHAVDHWRARAKAGETVDARIVTTSSGAGLFGSVSQANYSAAKAGIAAFTIVSAVELSRYGVKINGIAPSARSRMTEEAFAEMMKRPDSGFDAMDPANVSPVVVWLGSTSCDVTGKMFETAGGQLSVADGWQHGEVADKGDRYVPSEVGGVVADLLTRAPAPAAVYGAG
ncbi:MAG: SDR family oxidoreductase [Actinomycetota bacterium]|nr:SDR family oxidoreductase [Actinomycetota bacterium]MDA2971705.1 SDR family oxidoreductase [Actinomycetota bacterium]MDA3001451.1 SDR family oxidoreductase [Actinomycetota bacterium]